MKNRLTIPQIRPEDKKLDLTLRPRNLTEYIGQEKIKENLRIFIEAAKKRNQSLEHVLLHGGPGLGKTTLAHIISHEIGSNIRVTSGPAIEKTGDLAAILTNLQDGDIFFIDEIHRLGKTIEEVLFPAMEEYALDIVIGRGPSARTLRLDLPHFTLIGATTRINLLSSPLRDRFGVVFRLNFYGDEDIKKIIQRSAKILNIELEDEAALEIAKRARKTPRVANRLLKRVRDYTEVKGENKINRALALEALHSLEIDELGLDETDREILRIIIEKFKGGPVGLNTLAAAISEEKETIEDIYEPFLIQLGFLERTPKGRLITEAAYKHLGFPCPKERLF
jgi:Holliday junction DNA helicase RuvB